MQQHDVQGKFLGLPYDFRGLSTAKLKARFWNPEGSMLSPHAWGWGYTLNLAHRGTWVTILLTTILLAAVAQLG